MEGVRDLKSIVTQRQLYAGMKVFPEPRITNTARSHSRQRFPGTTRLCKQYLNQMSKRAEHGKQAGMRVHHCRTSSAETGSFRNVPFVRGEDLILACGLAVSE